MKPDTKIKAMANGATNLIMNSKTFFNEAFIVPSLVISSKNFVLPNFQPTKMTINKPPKGKSTLEVTKSRKSKQLIPAM